LLPYGVVDPFLHAARIQTIVVVLTPAVATPVTHVGDQFLVTVFPVGMRIQENGTT
jgi:hypothetical protein